MSRPICIIGFLLFGITSNILSQSLKSEYTWSELDWFSLTPPSGVHSAYCLYRDYSIDYQYSANDNLVEYYFYHTAIMLYDEKAVEDYNKIYIKLSNVISLNDFRARVITKDAPPKELSVSAVKEGVTEEGVKYKYAAVEGAEVGCVVEYYYVLEKFPDINGSIYKIRDDIPIREFRFRVASPENLIFNITAINDTAQARIDTNYRDFRVLTYRSSDQPAQPDDEEFSNSARTCPMLVCKLKGNTKTGSRNLYSYADINNDIYESLLSAPDKKQVKLIQDFFNVPEIKFSRDSRDRIRQIENRAKNSISIVEGSAPQHSDIASILENRIAGEYGMVKLLAAAYTLHEIPFEVVITSNRYNIPFSPTVENYGFLDEYLFYFPELSDYIFPSSTIYRLGIVPYHFTNNYGLFIRKLNVGSIETGAGQIKFIEPYPMKHSEHNHFITATMNDSATTVKVLMKEQLTGYYAINMQPWYDYYDAKEIEELKSATIRSAFPNLTSVRPEVENPGVKHFMIDPYIVKSEFDYPQLMEVANKTILLKVGELIGPQVELYQKSRRVLPVENDYLRSYSRELTVKIPNGYVCKNISDLEMNVNPFLEQHTAFTSEAQLKDDAIVISIKEYYGKMEIDLTEYERFQMVINAAADFNKKKLIFEKL